MHFKAPDLNRSVSVQDSCCQKEEKKETDIKSRFCFFLFDDSEGSELFVTKPLRWSSFHPMKTNDGGEHKLFLLKLHGKQATRNQEPKCSLFSKNYFLFVSKLSDFVLLPSEKDIPCMRQYFSLLPTKTIVSNPWWFHCMPCSSFSQNSAIHFCMYRSLFEKMKLLLTQMSNIDGIKINRTGKTLDLNNSDLKTVTNLTQSRWMPHSHAEPQHLV